MKDDAISMEVSDGIGWIKLFGESHPGGAQKLQSFLKSAIRVHCYRFVVDLHDCRNIDEHLLGTFVGLIFKFREKRRGELRIVRCRTEIIAKFRALGLENLLGI